MSSFQDYLEAVVLPAAFNKNKNLFDEDGIPKDELLGIIIELYREGKI